MDDLINYSTLYPEIPYEIISFFSKNEPVDNKIVPKKVMDFCTFYQKKYPAKAFPQPRIIVKICDIFCENHQLSVVHRGGIDGTDNSYYGILRDNKINESPFLELYFKKKLDYIVYGFKHIYQDYKQYVLPVEYTDTLGNKSLGTCFLYDNGIVTAKHCIEGASKISIQGFTKEDLAKSKFEVHENKLMDLLYIRLLTPPKESIMFSQKAEILDEVMTLGYPKIPGYHNFMTAENATVSARFTTSFGQIVSNAEDIWIKEKLFLVTAKIKGGNSGGPVVAKNGSVVGVSVNLSTGEGDYDDLGYGTVIPIEFVESLINSETKKYLDTNKIEFLDFN